MKIFAIQVREAGFKPRFGGSVCTGGAPQTRTLPQMGVACQVIISLSAIASYVNHSEAFLYVAPLLPASLWGLQAPQPVSSAASSFRSIWGMSGTTQPDLDQSNTEASRPSGSQPPFR